MTLHPEFLLAFGAHFGSDLIGYEDEQQLVESAKSCVSNLAVLDCVDLNATSVELRRFLEEMDRKTILTLSYEANTEWFENLPALRFVIAQIVEQISSYASRDSGNR